MTLRTTVLEEKSPRAVLPREPHRPALADVVQLHQLVAMLPQHRGHLPALVGEAGFTLAQKMVGRAVGLPEGQGVRPGTYTVRFDVPPGVNVVGGADQQVTVPANTAATLQARFTGNLVTSVSQAKARPVGSSVTVEGVVTTTLGEFTSTGTPPIGNVYVQDASGGIQVFGIPVSQGLVPGDSVRVTGTLGTFSGEVQITTPGLTVTELGTGTVPSPRLLTGAQFASRAAEGSLVRVNELTVTSVGSQTTANSSYNVGATAPDGTAFTVRVEGRTDLERTAFTVGQTYNITGISAAFTSGGVTVAQLKPRSTADVVRVSPLTVAEARALPLGTEVITRGVVTAAPGTFSSSYMYIQDRTGGLLVYRFFRSTTVQPGDSVQVTGAIRNPFGEFQVDTVTRADSVVVTVLALNFLGDGLRDAADSRYGQLLAVADYLTKKSVWGVGG